MACTFHRIYIEVRSVFSKLLGKDVVDAIEEGKASPPESPRATPEQVFGTLYMEVVSTPEERRRKRRQRGAKRVRQLTIIRNQKREEIIAHRELYKRNRFHLQAKLNKARAHVTSNSFGTQTDPPLKTIVPTASVDVQTISQTLTQVKEVFTQTADIKETCTQTAVVKEICTQTAEMKEICTQTAEVKEIYTQTVEMKEICTQTSEVKEICTQTADVKEICTQTVAVKEICTQTAEVKEICTQTAEVKEICTQTPAVKEICTQTAEVKEICTQTAEVREICTQTADMKEIYTQTVKMKEICTQTAVVKEICTQTAEMKETFSQTTEVKEFYTQTAEIKEICTQTAELKETITDDDNTTSVVEAIPKTFEFPLNHNSIAARMEKRSEDMVIPLQGIIYDLVSEVVGEVIEEVAFEALEEEMMETEDGSISGDDEVTVMEDTPDNADTVTYIEKTTMATQSDMSLAAESYAEDVISEDFTDSEDDDEIEFAESGAYVPVNGARSSFSTILEEDELALDICSESGYGSNQSLNSPNAQSQETGSMKISLGYVSDDEGVDAELKINLSNLHIEVTDSAFNKATRNEIIPELYFSLCNGALNVIGRGSYGNVYKAYYHGDDVAVKVTALRRMSDLPESQVMIKLEYHSCIIEILANYSVLNKIEGIVMEAAKGTTTDLICQIGGSMLGETVETVFDPFYTVYFTSAISQAITYMHDMGIVHLDINPSNILLMDSGIPKVSDFSSAVMWEPDQNNLDAYPIGTEGFQAPEVIMETGYNSRADWFAFGAVLCYVNIGRLPWGTCQMTKMEMIETGTLEKYLVDSDLFHQHLLGLVLILLQLDPELRMTCHTEELLNAFYCHEVSRDLMVPPDTPTLKFIQTQFTR